MGNITFGIPKDIIGEMIKIYPVNIFIETGTFQGQTTRWAAKYFETVHTIEKSESLYQQYHQDLSEIQGITPHYGDSRNVLPEILKSIDDRPVIYWLDGHWCGGETAGEADECPILDELRCLNNRPQDIILIDDARLFLCAPPSFHNPADWPTISDVILELIKFEKMPFVQILNDVIFIIPDNDLLKNKLIQYAQKHSDITWKRSSRLMRIRKYPGKKIKQVIQKVKRLLASE